MSEQANTQTSQVSKPKRPKAKSMIMIGEQNPGIVR